MPLRLSRVPAVVLVTAVGLILRLVNLPGRTTEYDEIVSILFARAGLAAMVRGTAADTMPPLYYGLLHVWQAIVPMDGLAAARIPSVVFGTITIPLVYALGRKLTDRRAALIGALILAVSPFHIFYAQFARMYSLLCLLAVAGAYFLICFLQQGRLRDWAGFVAAGTAALYTHNLAVVNLAGLDLAALLLVPGLKDRRRALWRLGAAHLLMAALYLPWLSFLPGQLEKIDRAFWIPRPGLAELIRTMIVFVFNLPAPGWLLPLLLFWVLLLLVLTGVQFYRSRRAAVDRRGVILLVALTVAPVALMFLISQVRPIYVERGVMLSSAALFLLLGWGLSRIPSRTALAGVACGSTLLLVVMLGYYYTYAEFPRSPYRQAAEFLAGEVAPGGFVLHDTKLSFFPMNYFRPDLPQGFIADPPGSPNDTLAPGTMETFGLFPTDPSRALRDHSHVWLVLHQRALDEASAAGVPHAHLLDLTGGRPPLRTERVGDLVLLQLQPGQ